MSVMHETIEARIRAFPKSRILSIVGEDRIRQLKISDPAPEIRAYVVGREGQARFEMPDADTMSVRTFQWFDRAVRWIHDRLTVGTKVFNRHVAGTNEHEGRIPIGEVVGKDLIDDNGSTATVAAIYVFPEARDMKLDVASMEADISFEPADGGPLVPTSVQSITGIALSDGSIDSPGFPGARLLERVAAFHGKEDETMNKTEVAQAVKDLGLKPSDLFDVSDIMVDAKVEEKVKAEKSNLYAQSKRLEKELETARDDAAKASTLHAEELEQLRAESYKTQASGVLDTIMKGRNMPDKQQEFVRGRLGELKTSAENEAGLTEDVKQFVDAQTAEFSRMAKLFGIEEKDAGAGGEQDTSKQDTGAGKPASTAGQLPFESSPPVTFPPREENPFIPGTTADIALGQQ